MNITQLKQGSLNGLRNQTNECLDNAYNKGYLDGRKGGFAYCRDNTELTLELKKQEYTKGYNTAINDYNMMIQWLHDCTDDFKEFMNKKYGYDIMYLTNPKVDEGVMLYDLICDHDMAEVISEFQKWQEEKKKVGEKIQVGDIVIHKDDKIKGVVYRVEDGLAYGTNCYLNPFEWVTNLCVKVGHMDEIETLLDKLRGEV